MPVVNLQALQTMAVNAGQFRGRVQIYRTGQGIDPHQPGHVDWIPIGIDKSHQSINLSVGETGAFIINGDPGEIINFCNSMVQVLAPD